MRYRSDDCISIIDINTRKMNTKLTFACCFTLLIAGLNVNAQSSFASYGTSGNVKEKVAVNLITSQAFVTGLVDTYKFKKGITIDTFAAYNPAVLPLARVGRNTYKKSPSRVYLKIMETPLPEGPGKITVDKNGYVSAYSYIVNSSKDQTEVDNMYDALISKMTRYVDQRYILNITNGVTINIPESDTVVTISKIDAGRWHAVGIYFN